MKINCNEAILTALANRGTFVKEGRLNYRKETKKYFKERWFKLRANLLFYYKTNDFGIICEDEPKGCLILVRYSVQVEYVEDTSFAFSITFKGTDETHYFAGQNADHCLEWVEALQSVDVDILRQQLYDLKMELPHRTNCEGGSSLFKKTGKQLNAIPKRYEKRLTCAEDRSKRDFSVNAARKPFPKSTQHIPRAKSSSALEQVRKSYSLASLMLDKTDDNDDIASVKEDPGSFSPVNKSTIFYVDKHKFFFDFDDKEVSCQSLDAVPSKSKKPSKIDLFYQQSAVASQLSAASSLTPLIDFYDKGNYHSSKQKAWFYNDALLPQHVAQSLQHLDQSKQNSQPCSCDRFKTKQEKDPNQLGIILQPLSLFSNPFINSYTKPDTRSKTGSRQKSLTRQGCSLVDPEGPTENQKLLATDLNGIYRRPRSCTLAQLESIPLHLLSGNLPSESHYDNGGNERKGERATLPAMGAHHNNVAKSSFQDWETFDD